MQFSKALPRILNEFERKKIDFALVGGLALYALGVSRATFDADFLILLAQANEVDHIMKELGYQSIHLTANIANYSSADPEMGQVDFLFAQREYAVEMLKRAAHTKLMSLSVKVVCPEDLIGLKVQSSSNDPDRVLKDKADIEEILDKYHRTLNWALVEEYYRVFKREAEFKSLAKKFR